MSENARETTYESGRHPVNVTHLVMGVAFASLALIWAFITGDVVENEDIRWLMPAPWVLAGAVGLVAVTLASRRRSQPTFAEPTYTEPTPTETTDDTETTPTENTTDTEEFR